MYSCNKAFLSPVVLSSGMEPRHWRQWGQLTNHGHQWTRQWGHSALSRCTREGWAVWVWGSGRVCEVWEYLQFRMLSYSLLVVIHCKLSIVRSLYIRTICMQLHTPTLTWCRSYLSKVNEILDRRTGRCVGIVGGETSLKGGGVGGVIRLSEKILQVNYQPIKTCPMHFTKKRTLI